MAGNGDFVRTMLNFFLAEATYCAQNLDSSSSSSHELSERITQVIDKLKQFTEALKSSSKGKEIVIADSTRNEEFLKNLNSDSGFELEKLKGKEVFNDDFGDDEEFMKNFNGGSGLGKDDTEYWMNFGGGSGTDNNFLSGYDPNWTFNTYGGDGTQSQMNFQNQQYQSPLFATGGSGECSIEWKLKGNHMKKTLPSLPLLVEDWAKVAKKLSTDHTLTMSSEGKLPFELQYRESKCNCSFEKLNRGKMQVVFGVGNLLVEVGASKDDTLILSLVSQAPLVFKAHVRKDAP